eukprot:288483-Prorocentrum_minimum.AAC.3
MHDASRQVAALGSPAEARARASLALAAAAAGGGGWAAALEVALPKEALPAEAHTLLTTAAGEAAGCVATVPRAIGSAGEVIL